jgi:hypothetical protein
VSVPHLNILAENRIRVSICIRIRKRIRIFFRPASELCIRMGTRIRTRIRSRSASKRDHMRPHPHPHPQPPRIRASSCASASASASASSDPRPNIIIAYLCVHIPIYQSIHRSSVHASGCRYL